MKLQYYIDIKIYINKILKKFGPNVLSNKKK